MPMHPDVRSLLQVQVDDLEMYALEKQLGALAPRLAVLEKERGKVTADMDRTKASITAEEAQHREAMGKVELHKALVERSQRAYESVTTPREANAAMTQLEQSKRMESDSMRDASGVLDRINQLRHHLAELETALADVESRQSATRESLDVERKEIEGQVDEARKKRESSAVSVSKALLAKYDRVRLKRRNETVFPLRGQSCSACDTAVPTQRRSAMAASGSLEMCEGCGVLLYAGD